MFRKIENSETQKVLSSLGDDAVSVRIKANISVYGAFFDFAEAWAQYDEKGEITAVFLKINRASTLTFSSSADKEEIRAFLDFVSYDTLFLEEEKARALSLDFPVCGDILRFCRKADGVYGADCFADMKEAYRLISENEGKGVIHLDYLEWLSDFTYKKNRNAARLRAVTEDGELVSFAMTSAETESGALISGVFTGKDKRNRGFGERALMSLTQSLISDNKTVYIMTADERMTAYYEKRGFVKVSRWTEGRKNV